MKFLDMINLYGKEIKILVDKNESINSRFSKILTFITILIIITFTWIIGKDVIYKNNPLSYINQVLSPFHPKINITKETFPIAIGLFGLSNTPMFNSSIIDVKLTKSYSKFDEVTGDLIEHTDENIELTNCTYESFPTISKEDFDKNILTSYLCPKNLDLFIEGYWNNNNLTFLTIIASKCNPEKNSCMKEEEIDEYIFNNSINLNLLTLSTIISLSDYSNPLTFYGNLLFKFLHNKNTKITSLFMQKQKIISDSGIFTNSMSEIEYIKLVETQNDQQEMSPISRYLMVYSIYASNISENFNRKYLKIYDVIASIGGFLKIITMVFKILNSPFADIDKIKMFLDNVDKKTKVSQNINNTIYNINKFTNNNINKKINMNNNINFNDKNDSNIDNKNFDNLKQKPY